MAQERLTVLPTLAFLIDIPAHFLMIRRRPRSTLFTYTALFRFAV